MIPTLHIFFQLSPLFISKTSQTLLTLDRQTKRNEDDLKVTLEYISYILTHVTGDRNRQAVTAEVREERGRRGEQRETVMTCRHCLKKKKT